MGDKGEGGGKKSQKIHNVIYGRPLVDNRHNLYYKTQPVQDRGLTRF